MAHKRTLDPFLLIGSIILIAAGLTWVLPAGRFERTKDSQSGRTLVVPGSYKAIPPSPVGPWGALMAVPQGLLEAAEVVFFVLLGGGALTVVEATGAIESFLNHLLARLGNRPLLVLAFASLLFWIGGAADNMYEEILAFIPLLCSLTRRLHLNHELALGISIGTATVAACFSPFNTFTLGIAQPMAEVPLFSGFLFRAVIFVLATGIWGGYLAWYTRRLRASKVHHTAEVSEVHPAAARKWRRRDLYVLAVMNGALALIVGGGVFLHWGLREFSAVFVFMGILGGWFGGLGWRGTSEQFAEGIRRLAVAAALVGLARAISVVLANGMILDTIANALFSPLRHLSLTASAGMMLVSESVLAFPMPSDSGRAVMSLPILVPLSDLLGLSRQMVVIAYQYSGLLSGLITPTSGALLAMLATAEISLGRWIRFVAIPAILLFVLAALAILIGVKLGVQ